MKKFLAIFLIFFLLFGSCVPAFASQTSDILPPNLEAPYDSYAISLRTFTSGDSSYTCYLYSSADWKLYVKPNETLVRFVSLNSTPSPVYYKSVYSSSYNPDSDNNGWGTFTHEESMLDTVYSDGTVFYYGNIQGSLTLSNRDVPYAVVNYDTNSLDLTGGFFFTLTPPLVVETTKALTLFQSQTIQTVLTLALCGVGCLALLISLVLLRKVLFRFLNK